MDLYLIKLHKGLHLAYATEISHDTIFGFYSTFLCLNDRGEIWNVPCASVNNYNRVL